MKKAEIIQSPQEFSFDQCYTFINRSSKECLHQAFDNKIRKLLKFDGKYLLLEIKPTLQKHLEINFLNITPTKKEVIFARNYISEWFDLTTDINTFYDFASGDNVLNVVSKKYFGLRLIGIPDLFEAIIWPILGQQINLSFAYSLKRKFVEEFGDKYFFDNCYYYTFPLPERISILEKKDLTKMQFSNNKAEYVIQAARAVASGQISKEILQKLSLSEAKEKLCKIHGIGNWTANYALMKCLRNPDAFPIEDVGLHNAIKKLLNLSEKPSIEQIKYLSTNWKGWYAYSTFYLWRSLLD